jgi:hypothetical protein
MRYEEIIENYTPEMQLIDALDYLRDRPWLSAEILDRLASDSNNEKTDASLPQKGPNPATFSQDIQLLSTDWEPQYKSQGDSISISSPDNDEEQEWEYPYPPQNRYLIQHDVDLSSDHHPTSKFD